MTPSRGGYQGCGVTLCCTYRQCPGISLLALKLPQVPQGAARPPSATGVAGKFQISFGPIKINKGRRTWRRRRRWGRLEMSPGLGLQLSCESYPSKRRLLAGAAATCSNENLLPFCQESFLPAAAGREQVGTVSGTVPPFHLTEIPVLWLWPPQNQMLSPRFGVRTLALKGSRKRERYLSQMEQRGEIKQVS